MKTVYAGGEGEIVEKKSRFIANVRPVSSEEEAVAAAAQADAKVARAIEGKNLVKVIYVKNRLINLIAK